MDTAGITLVSAKTVDLDVPSLPKAERDITLSTFVAQDIRDRCTDQNLYLDMLI